VNQGRGKATIIPPVHLKGQQDYLWKWRIPITELDQILLVRDVILTTEGKLKVVTCLFEHCGLAYPASCRCRWRVMAAHGDEVEHGIKVIFSPWLKLMK
jgi:hypothetical protein